MTAPRTITLVRDAFPERPAIDTAISRAILHRVADGLEPETLRLYRPADFVAFGPTDLFTPGYAQAAAVARSAGYGAVLRMAGGKAAVFHGQTIAFSWTIPDPNPRASIYPRYEEVTGIMAAAFRRLGVDARVGEIPSEYCPGAYSINARGQKKLLGVGQRLVAQAVHVGGVIVVGQSARVRDILIPVYDALGLSWNPETAGSIEDEVGAIRFEDVVEAIAAEFGARYSLVEGGVSPETLALADTLEHEHIAPERRPA